MKIAVFTTMPEGLYSGGRYLAQILAHSLNRAGADVTYIASNKAMFDADFAPYDADLPLRKIISPDYQLPADFDADWVVVIPTGGFDQKFYNAALSAARTRGARVALLSFETPNWFNGLSPFARSAMPTESWRQVVSRGGAVITIANEGIAPARTYFGAARDDLAFDYWHPPINDLAAARAVPIGDGRRRVMCFTRTEDQHKGAQDLLKIDPAVLEGCTLSMVFGRGINTQFAQAASRHFGQAHDITIELHDRISDAEKFDLLASSDLLLFPSYFEGFGYPPVEAAYMGVPSVAYDLPLLHETVATAALYAPLGDTAAFSDRTAEALGNRLEGRLAPDTVRDRMLIAPDTQTAGARFIEILTQAARKIAPQSQIAPMAVTVPGAKPTLVDQTAQYLMLGLEGDLQVEQLEMSLRGDTLRIQGRVSGNRANRRLRFGFPDTTLPDVHFTRNDGAAETFDICGNVESWPAGVLMQIGDLSVIEQGGKLNRKRRFEVTASAQVLLQRRFVSETSQGAAARGAACALFVIPAPVLFGTTSENLVTALHVATMARVFAAQGMTTDLRLLDGPVVFSPACEPDFLPLLDKVAYAAADISEAAVKTVLEQGGIAVVEAGLAQAWAAALPKGAAQIPVGAQSELALIHTAKLPRSFAQTLTDVLTPAVLQTGRRSMIRKQQQKLLVLAPPSPIAALPDGLRTLLADLHTKVAQLTVVLPRRLCLDDVLPDPWFGGTGAVAVEDEASVLAAGETAGSVVVLGWDAVATRPDIVLQGLVGTLPQAQWVDTAADAFADTQRLSAQLSAALAVAADADTLRIALAPLISQTPHARTSGAGSRQPLLNTAFSAALTRPAYTPATPVLSRVQSLCFAGPTTDSRAALRTGWGSMSETGAMLKETAGVIGFHAPVAERLEGTLLEVMLELRDIPKQARVTLLLNGMPAGSLQTARQGTVTLQVTLEPGHWRGAEDTAQYLAVHLEGANRCNILAVSLSDPRPDELDWDTLVPQTDRQATLRRALPQAFHFANGEVPKGLLLRTGWHQPENQGCWSGGTYVALGFDGPIQSRGPVIMHLRGKAYLPRSGITQTIGLACGLNRLAQAHLTTPASTGITLALPADLCRDGIDTLFMEYANTYSPKQLGLSEDSRMLGYFLEDITLTRAAPAPAQVFDLDAGAQTMNGAVLTLPCRSGLLRITGSGPLPEEVGFGFAGTGSVALPQRDGTSGDAAWAADVALPRDAQTAPALTLVALSLTEAGTVAPLPAITQIAYWPAAIPEEESSEPVDVTLRWSAGTSPRVDLNEQSHRPDAGIDFGLAAQPHTVLGKGWAQPEAGSVWSTGAQARLDIMAGDPRYHRIAVMTAHAFVPEAVPLQRMTLGLGADAPLATLLARREEAQRYVVPLPPSAPPHTAQVPYFDLPDAASPSALGLSEDTRLLGIRLSSFHIETLGPADRVLETDWATGVVDHGLILIGNNPTGAVLRLTGHGPAPHGVHIAQRSRVVMHPVADAATNTWFAEVFLDDQRPDQEWHIETLRPSRPDPARMKVDKVMCTFRISPTEETS